MLPVNGIIFGDPLSTSNRFGTRRSREKRLGNETAANVRLNGCNGEKRRKRDLTAQRRGEKVVVTISRTDDYSVASFVIAALVG